MSSSCWHGVTSVVMGNCGMTFAPVRPGQAEVLATAMESVEDIPASASSTGSPGTGRPTASTSTPSTVPRGINAGGYVGDVALRLYVAGDAACEQDFALDAEQKAEMARLVEDSLEAGAFGYSMSRSLFHRAPDGRYVPGTWSEPRGVLRDRRTPRPPRPRRAGVRPALQRGERSPATGSTRRWPGWPTSPGRSADRSASTSADPLPRRSLPPGARAVRGGQPHRRPAPTPDHAPERRRPVQPGGQHAGGRPAIVPAELGAPRRTPRRDPRPRGPRPPAGGGAPASRMEPFERMFLMPVDSRPVRLRPTRIAGRGRRPGAARSRTTSTSSTPRTAGRWPTGR